MPDLPTGQSRPDVYADLGDNLIIRSARREDAAAVAELVYGAHAAKGNPDDSVLIPQNWTYGGIPFGVSRVELASPDCRARDGIPRQLLEVLFPKADSSVWPIA